MKILLDGYFDNNFGDDLLLTLAAQGLRNHELYITSKALKIEHVSYTTDKSGFDCYVKVIGSGFIINSNKWLLYRVRDMIKEYAYSKKRAVIGCNINKFINKLSESVIKRQLKSYGLITVRDRTSYEYIRKHIEKNTCACYPDMVFSLPDSMIPDISAGNILGISVHNSENHLAVAKTADMYAEKTGASVRLLCFDTGNENDGKAAKTVYEHMRCKDTAEIVYYENIPKMLASIKSCRVILGVRFHSIVLAARMGVPFVPLAYSEKTVNVLSDLGYNNTVYDAEDFDCEMVAESLLTAHKYNLPQEIIEAASGHIEKLKEYISDKAGKE